MRSPRAWLVLMQGCCIPENGIDDSPSSLNGVLANEKHGISVHSISQKTFTGINLVRGVFLYCRKLRGHGDEFFAGTFHAGAEAIVQPTRSSGEAEMIGVFASQIPV